MRRSLADIINWSFVAIAYLAGVLLFIWFFNLGYYNLLFNGFLWMLFSFGLTAAPFILFLTVMRKHISLPEIPLLYSVLAWGTLCISLSVSFATSALMSYDWNPDYGIPNIIENNFHVHHVGWTSFYLVLIFGAWFYAFFLKNWSVLSSKIQSLIENFISFGFLAWGLGLAFILFFGEISHSFKIAGGFVSGGSLIMWFMLVKTSSTHSYKIAVSIVLGVILGIWLEGMVILIKKFPEAVIFFKGF